MSNEIIFKKVGTVFHYQAGDVSEYRCNYEDKILNNDGNVFADDYNLNCEIEDNINLLLRLRMSGNSLAVDKDLSNKSESEKKLGARIQEFMRENNIDKISIQYVALYNNDSYEFVTQQALKGFMKGLNAAHGYKTHK